MKNLFTKNYWAMKGLALLVLVMMGGREDVMGQTTVFSDNFNTSQGSSYSTSAGAVGSSGVWSLSRLGADWGVRINGGNLDLTNDAGATTNVAGWVYGYTPVSTFSSPYNSTLSSNPGVVTWTFNLKTNRTSVLAGFSSTTSYGLAMVLASTSTSVGTSGSGYAVIMGGGTANNLGLYYFTEGLQGTRTAVVAFGNPAPASLTNYMSVKITYTPTTNSWAISSRDDGASAAADPASGILTSIGSGVNSTGTVTNMPYLGACFQGSTGATQSSFFDNVKVTVAPASSNSTASDIINKTGYSYSSNIDYASKQTETTLTTANSIGVNGLTLRDGGATTDADALGTTLTDITFSTGGSTAIRSAALFDGATNIAEVAVNGATSIAFTGLSLSATDGSTKDFELRVTYQSNVTDNQQITYTVSSATASAATSSFASANAGAAASTITADNNRLEVSISSLVFSQQPSNVNTNVSMSPSVTVTARDANNNIDLDFTDNVRVTSNGTMTGSPVSVAAVNGVASFSSLTHTALGSALTLLAERDNSNTWDLDVTSSTFNVAVVTSSTDYFRSLATGSWATAASWESSTDGSTNWITATLSPTSSANAITIRNGHTITISAVVSIDQVTVQSGGILTLSAAITINNGTSDDISVESGGIVKYTVNTFTYSASSNIRIKSGGLLSVETSGLTSVGSGVNSTTHIYEDASILQLNLGTSTPSTSGVTFFPNVTSEIPILRFASAPTGGMGGGTSTIINGRLELSSGISISWVGNSTKIFKYGVVGLGGIQTMTLNSGTGSWLISGSSAQLGTNGGTSLTLTNANGINISSTTTATLIGNLNIGASTTFTLKSDANGTANIGNSVGTITGNVTVERYIPATRRAYRFLAAPVTTTGGVYASWQASGTNAAGLGIHVTGIASATGGVDDNTGLDKTLTGSSSMFTYNGSAWAAVTNTKTTQLTPGAGFRVLVRGDRTTDLYASTTPNPTVTTVKATGTVGQGTINLTNLVDGFNLIGNPYPSSIDWIASGWQTLRTASNVNNAIYIYNPAEVAATSMTYPAYVDGVGTNGGNNIIRSGQAFFVHAAAAGASISFEEAYKSTTVTGGFFRSATPEMMRVTYMQNNEHLDDIVIRFDNDAQAGFDPRFDAISMGGDANGLASFKNADRLAIHTRPTAIGEDSVALSVRNTTTGNYQLKFSEMEGFASSTDITLLDKFLNVQYDVKQDSIVAFEITTDVNSKGDDRFWLFYNHKSTGINQQALAKNKINVYPNPASSVINMSLKLTANQKSTYTYNIYNQLGAMVQAGEVDFANGKQAQINIDAFSPGVYFITASNGKDLQTIKFIK